MQNNFKGLMEQLVTIGNSTEKMSHLFQQKISCHLQQSDLIYTQKERGNKKGVSSPTQKYF
jgi:hypothetical protein